MRPPRPARRAALAACLGALVACGPAPPEPSLNVLLVTVDTLRADRLGFDGYGLPTSPRLDALAESGVVFDRAQGASSWTLPSLATILTSLYTSTHGCWTFVDPLQPSFHTLAETLRDAGYDTAAVASHVFLGTDYGLHQGFTHFDDDLVHWLVASHDAISSPEVSDKGIRFLENKAAVPEEGPWLLWLHYFDPHEIYQPHEGFLEPFGIDPDARGTFDVEQESRLYDGEVAFTDHHVGRVLDALERLGLADDTLVVFVADHGEEFGDHGSRRHGHTLYGELVRTPLVVRAPGFAPSRVDALVHTVDLAPTVLELVGLAPVADQTGRSLVPLMRGEELPERGVLAELNAAPSTNLRAWIDGRWKLILDLDHETAKLFDVEADPLEQSDVAAGQPQVVARMRQELLDAVGEALHEGRLYERTAHGLKLLATQDEQLKNLGYTGGR